MCIQIPLDELRSAASNTVSNLLLKNQHIPELGVASAVQERLSELLGEKVNAGDRTSMSSESRRRETYSQWPHMDYKYVETIQFSYSLDINYVKFFISDGHYQIKWLKLDSIINQMLLVMIEQCVLLVQFV